MRIIPVVVVAAGCSVPPPFYGLEAPSTLPPGRVLVMAGGGGGANSHGGFGGGAGRVRIGIGHDQEVGLDAAMLSGGDSPTEGAKLVYKAAVSDRVALSAGAGGMYHGDSGKNATVGGDLGAIVGLGSNGPVTFFGALRGSVAVPVGAMDRYAIGGISETATLPIGLQWAPSAASPAWRILAEVGAIAGLAERRDGSNDKLVTDDFGGGYAALAIAWTH